jgi:superfamily II RNA helicase
MNENNLTQKGILASEIHEGHPLLMSHAFVTQMLHKMSSRDIVKSLSVFLEDVKIDEVIEPIDFHVEMKKIAVQIAETEQLKSDDSYWNLTSYWAEVVERWLNGDDLVCDQLGIEQGNFVRAMLKLSNIVEEWINMAIICQDVEMVEKMNEVTNLIVRGFVIPDSLYLRI